MICILQRFGSRKNVRSETRASLFARGEILPLTLLAMLVPLVAAAADPVRIELVVDEPYADRAAAWPVTTGVPFPKGALRDPAHCRLLDDMGQEQTLQSRVAAPWDAEKTSIRWLTIDFLARPGRKYHLEFGPEVRRRAEAGGLRIDGSEAGTTSLISGPLRVDFMADGPGALGTIALDLNRDGTFDARERVAGGAATGDHYYRDARGQLFTSAADAADRKIIVEEQGPVRACVRVDGFYTGPKGERIVRYRTRYHLFAGLGLMKIVNEFGIVGSTKDTRFTDIGLGLQLGVTTEGRTVAADSSGAPGNQVVSFAWQPDTTWVSSYQSTYRHWGNREAHAAVVAGGPEGNTTLSESNRIGEWLQVRDGRASVTGTLRWMWQQFPAEWEVTPDQLVLHLWSPRGGELSFSKEGMEAFLGPAGHKYLVDIPSVKSKGLDHMMNFAGFDAMQRGDADGLGTNKHHEVFLHFAPAEQAEAGAEYGRLAANQPLGLASGEWNCSTDVFGPLIARPNKSGYEMIVDRVFDLARKAQDEFGDYGWWVFGAGWHYSYQWDPVNRRHYADPRRFEHHTYQRETQLWWNYLRSGERKFYDWAIPSENHWADMAVTHTPVETKTEWLGGRAVPSRQVDFRPGDWVVDSPATFVRQHDTGEAWLRGGAQFWASYHRTLETTTLAYYLTGDERFKDILDFWIAYWRDLAGKTSASPDVRPWFQQQAWYTPTAPGQPAKTWAEMIRDYAPFDSGSRHQLTLFFNLATLYENCWDPVIGQVVREYADAFIDPQQPNGVWSCYDNRLPCQAESPSMAHFWMPALWKYARATRDPRMDEVLRRYSDAGYGVDPFREEVGTYSPTNIAWAYYFSRDPKHLLAARKELRELLPRVGPLKQPQDLHDLIYNPYTPLYAFTATPRLTWALEHARSQGIVVPEYAPLLPQRAPIALQKPAGQALQATLWTFDAKLQWVGPDARPSVVNTIETRKFSTAKQPFDRITPDHAVYQQRVEIPAASPAGWYVLAPRLESAVLSTSNAQVPLASAVQPIEVQPRDACFVEVPAGVSRIQFETAHPAALRLTPPDGVALAGAVTGTVVAFELPSTLAGKSLRIDSTLPSSLWFRILDWPAETCWVSYASPAPIGEGPLANRRPSREQAEAALKAEPYPAKPNGNEVFVDGRFGKALAMTPGRELRFQMPQAAGSSGTALDPRQGTIEFWLRREWDERLTPIELFPVLSGSGTQIMFRDSSITLPLGEWVHVALVWRPSKQDPERILSHWYVNGIDHFFYRNIWWDGYGQYGGGAPNGSLYRSAQATEEFISRCAKGAAYQIDDLRVSSVPRYADLEIELGHRFPNNTFRFTPPAEPLAADDKTLLLFRFDGDARGTGRGGISVEGKLKP